MRKDKIKGESFIAFLVKYYIGFTIAIALIILAAGYSYLLAEEGILKIPKVDLLINEKQLLKSGDYSDINASKLLGKKGYFEILDENNEVVFSSGVVKKGGYTKEEVSCIPDYYAEQSFYAQEYKLENGKERHLITEVTYKEDYLAAEDTAFAVLDENYQVIECSEKWKYNKLTEKEYRYLTQNGSDNYNIQKHNFINAEGKNSTVIIHTEKIDDANYRKLSKISAVILPAVIFLYIILIAFFSLWLNYKVRKPLFLLNGAMHDFTEGRRNMPIAYNGPREFMQICDSFNRMSVRLEESEGAKKKADEDRQKMLADISHDLKTPITVIQGYSKALCEGMIPDEKQGKYLNTIYYKANALTELINTFYELSRLEHPDFTLEKEKTDICEYCREYLAGKYEEIELSGFKMELSVPEEKIFCAIDRMQLKRVLENIIINSIKHNPPGTAIYFFVTDKGEAVEILLGDNGNGIPEELAETIFQAFTVGDESRNNKQGSGLGLAIAKKIVDAHEGTIKLVNPPSEGMSAEFIIRLPKILKM